ncbi:1-phosphatidylinositol 4,5-bisphosphate phosphodiesterase classes I and II-like [Ctenocephalides felis]|uniref:1-phosphatidylinositol 4,5-bisphosphate phosphodiesterase classes I and II-like n=1 Tax=Ctenocephalides felis TaxID=7515 RepID=UPI000E6E4DCF|nr:1-phosphatidylinositol 4,5-bisphosphate phosphodiesterase classes I and II-like [Ctenocephalides felis]
MEPELNADGEEDHKGEGGDKCDTKGDANVHLSSTTGSGSISSLVAKPQRRMTISNVACRRELLTSDGGSPHSITAGGSPRLHHRASVVTSTALGGMVAGGGLIANAATVSSLTGGTDDKEFSDGQNEVTSSGASGGDMPVVRTISAALQKALDQAIPVRSPEAIAAEDIKAETLEKLFENKSVAEKRLEMEKKIESLRKKQDKERQKSLEGSGLAEKRSSKFYMSSKLVKRLSSKNISDAPWSSAGSLGSVDGDSHAVAAAASCPALARLVREHAIQLKELQERYHETIYSIAEKALKQSQANQMKALRALLDRETAELGQILETTRRKEVKDLAKKHRDRDELIRMKREVATAIVERGVAERVRLAQDYERRIDVLQREHNLVKKNLEEHRLKAKNDLELEYSSRISSAECGETAGSGASTAAVSSLQEQPLEL